MTDILKYMSMIIALAAGAISIVKDNKNTSGKGLTKTGYLLLTPIVLGTIITAVIEYNSNKDSEKKEEKSTNQINSLKKINNSLKEDIRTLKNTLSVKNDSLRSDVKSVQDSLNNKISSLIKDNYELSKSLTNNTLQTNRYVLGDGYAVFILIGRAQSNQYFGIVESLSNYPIYDLSVSVTDFDETIKCRSNYVGKTFMIEQDCFLKNTKDNSVNILRPRNYSPFIYEVNSTEKYKKLEVKIYTRNTNILQQIIFKLQKGHCPQSYRTYQYLTKSDSFKLIKSDNKLNISDREWTQSFMPINRRMLGIDEKQYP
ncbi:MAG: hypothetical protein LH609_15405 [Rudanella sp.]|nr:hypothetical protein [Rudanella sp.]